MNLLQGLAHVASFIVPLITKVIFFQVQQTTKDSQQSSKDKKESLKLAKTLCIIFVMFVSCWAPYTVMAVSKIQSADKIFKILTTNIPTNVIAYLICLLIFTKLILPEQSQNSALYQ